MILTTKLHVPSLRRRLVPRQRLFELLDLGLRRKLTLVSAPAGFGKTTVLGEWASHLGESSSSPAKVGWISLDEGDNDPARFYAYLNAALQRTQESSGQAGSEPFDAAGAAIPEARLVSLINQVAEWPQSIVLVLDDYHRITTQAIQAAMTFLVEHLPENLHLVIATRADPPLPLPRLRAQGHLVEVRQHDLCFTTQETRDFLNRLMGLGLSEEDVAALEARTEGWIAGLQMAALSLQAHSSQPASRSEYVQAFAGSHRFVLDFLVEEVLEKQTPALQEFLLKTSILEQLCGPLCDALLAESVADITQKPAEPTTMDRVVPRAQSVLEGLESANLFILPLDDERGWYRYHRLFADLLQQRLRNTHPDWLPVLHDRASTWYEYHGLKPAAIDHALAAGDFERAAGLIEACAEATLMRSELVTFLAWMKRLPDEWVRERPTLCFFHAWALLLSGRSTEIVEQRLQDIARAQDGETSERGLSGKMAALRAYLMLFQADVPRAAILSRQALQQLPENELFLRSIASWILGLTRLTEGNLQDGQTVLKETAGVGQAAGNPLVAVIALCQQASLQMRQGRLHQAKRTLEEALQAATDRQGNYLPIASEALMGLGELEREWDHLETADDYLTKSIEFASRWSELSSFDAYFPLARLRLAQANVEGARQAIEAAVQLARRTEATKLDDLVAELQQAYFFVRQGEEAEVIRWAEKRGLPLAGSRDLSSGVDEPQDYLNAHLRKYELVILARWFIRQGRAAEALIRLETPLARSRQLGRVDLTIEILIQQALAYQLQGQEPRALEALSEALSLAEEGGFRRIFLDEGQPLANLLRRAFGRGIAPAYTAQLLEAFGESETAASEEVSKSPRIQSLIEPLSQRELEVLRLLAAGMSSPEIAGELYIAVSTVRSHCKSIFSKLEVHRRWDAVQRAQELGLI